MPRFCRSLFGPLVITSGQVISGAASSGLGSMFDLVDPFAFASGGRPPMGRVSLVGEAGPELERLRWMIEEFRLSLFAQDLRTLGPVSAKRLEAQLARARAESRGG